jgi:hypothetical protein
VTEELRSKAQKLADSLQEAGLTHQAAAVSNTLSRNLIGDAFLHALRGVCDTLLTAVEAIDPVSEMELERVRRAVDDFLTPEKPGG